MHYYKDLDPQEVAAELLKAGEAAVDEAARELGMARPRLQWFKEVDELSQDWADERAELGHSLALKHVIWVNVAQSLESVLHTIRHECQHVFEYSTGLLPRLKGQITATAYREAEDRAEAFARREDPELSGERQSLLHVTEEFLQRLGYLP